MKMDLNQTCSKDESWMEMAKDHVQWYVLTTFSSTGEVNTM
jgi:hypothetical protein